jgi:hypothetical protein
VWSSRQSGHRTGAIDAAGAARPRPDGDRSQPFGARLLRGRPRERISWPALVHIWVGVVLAGLLLGGPAAAGTPTVASVDDLVSGFHLLPPDQRLAFQDSPGTPAPEGAVAAAPAERRPNWLLTSLVSAGAVAGAAINSLADGPYEPYHIDNEGWFGRNTLYGGADKAAHFVDYYIVSKELANLFVVLGHPRERARWMGVGVSALTGLVNELGDGATHHGFSPEDLTMDIAGALSAAVIDAAKIGDLVGFRRGIANFDDCCNYSNEIYTTDFRLAGAARRLGINIGPLKYLLFSLTYGTRGYPGDSDTQRRVGLELGLDFKQILDDLNVRRNTWWGYGLHVVFDNIRVPYTAVGFRYDVNHGKWYGPNAGN